MLRRAFGGLVLKSAFVGLVPKRELVGLVPKSAFVGLVPKSALVLEFGGGLVPKAGISLVATALGASVPHVSDFTTHFPKLTRANTPLSSASRFRLLTPSIWKLFNAGHVVMILLYLVFLNDICCRWGERTWILLPQQLLKSMLATLAFSQEISTCSM